MCVKIFLLIKLWLCFCRYINEHKYTLRVSILYTCFTHFPKQTAIIFRNSINWVFFLIDTNCILCEVQTQFLCIRNLVHHCLKVKILFHFCSLASHCSSFLNDGSILRRLYVTTTKFRGHKTYVDLVIFLKTHTWAVLKHNRLTVSICLNDCYNRLLLSHNNLGCAKFSISYEPLFR